MKGESPNSERLQKGTTAGRDRERDYRRRLQRERQRESEATRGGRGGGE